MYGQLISLISNGIGEKENSRPKPRRKERRSSKRHKKRYIYARTQDLYRSNPGALARCIRERVSWWDDQGDCIPIEDLGDFYTTLWSVTPNTRIPFDSTPTSDRASVISNYVPITLREINARFARLKKDTPPGPDNIMKKHIVGPFIKEALRLFFNLILLRGIQPSTWGTNRTTLIPKQGKDHTRVENYRPITISSIMSPVLGYYR